MVMQKREVARKTYSPMTDKLVVSVIQAPNETDSGLALPESSQSKFVTMRAVVIACGPEVKQVKVNDVVLLPGGRYEPVIHKGQTTFVVAEVQIWGVEDREVAK